MKHTVGSFSIEQWAGGWMATARISGNEVQQFFGSTERQAADAAASAHARGIVPMCAIPEEQWQAEVALSHRRSHVLAGKDGWTT